MLYTRKGDKGTTKTLHADERIQKDSPLLEALGSVDELNSFLGLVKVKSGYDVVVISENKLRLTEIVESVQKNLFIIQAELAGADKKLTREKITEMEAIIDGIEKQLPPISSFLVSGGTELGALFDSARAIGRRAERRVVGLQSGELGISEHSMAYLNRLSSLLYALARYSNYKSGAKEPKPDYK